MIWMELTSHRTYSQTFYPNLETPPHIITPLQESQVPTRRTIIPPLDNLRRASLAQNVLESMASPRDRLETQLSSTSEIMGMIIVVNWSGLWRGEIATCSSKLHMLHIP